MPRRGQVKELLRPSKLLSHFDIDGLSPRNQHIVYTWHNFWSQIPDLQFYEILSKQGIFSEQLISLFDKTLSMINTFKAYNCWHQGDLNLFPCVVRVPRLNGLEEGLYKFMKKCPRDMETVHYVSKPKYVELQCYEKNYYGGEVYGPFPDVSAYSHRENKTDKRFKEKLNKYLEVIQCFYRYRSVNSSARQTFVDECYQSFRQWYYCLDRPEPAQTDIAPMAVPPSSPQCSLPVPAPELSVKEADDVAEESYNRKVTYVREQLNNNSVQKKIVFRRDPITGALEVWGGTSYDPLFSHSSLNVGSNESLGIT